MTPLDLPTGYVPLRGRWSSFAWHEAAPVLESMLGEFGSVDGWAAGEAAQDLAPTAVGRGPVHVVRALGPGPTRRDRWAVRHYRRGGAVAGALVDRYLRAGRARPLRELSASVMARERGVHTPAIVAGVCAIDGVFYRCDLVTEYVPDTRPLAHVVGTGEPSEVVGAALARAATLIRRLTDARVHHVDLHAGNVLIPYAADQEACVLDLDRARVLARRSKASGQRMKERLIRSLRSAVAGDDSPVTYAELRSILDADAES